MTCPHTNTLPRRIVGKPETFSLLCLECGEQLPLGPANDGGGFAGRIRVEVRAADVAAALLCGLAVDDEITVAEYNGWFDHEGGRAAGGADPESRMPGWMARVICAEAAEQESAIDAAEMEMPL